MCIRDRQWNTIYQCVPEGDYEVCLSFGDNEIQGWNNTSGYFYIYGYDEMYWDACNMNGTCSGNNGSQSCQGGTCEDGFEYEIYTYGGNCDGGERTFTLTDVNTGDIVWSVVVDGCNSQYNDVCLPYGDYDACIDPPFSQGRQFEVSWIIAFGGEVKESAV